MVKPTDRVKEVFELCTDTQIQPATRERLRGLLPEIEAAETAYEVAASAGELYTLRPVASALANEAVRVYDDRFQPEGSAGRMVYNRLLLSAPNRQCPFCGVGFVDSLDHYLPKQPFWSMAVMPINLIPSCDHCNHSKHTFVPTEDRDQLIHPYFDDFDDGIWLVAKVTESDSVAVTYAISNDLGWNPPKIERIRNHFERLELDVLYVAQAGNELSRDKQRYLDLYARGGADEVRQYVEEALLYAKIPPFRNDWKTALYRALTLSDWFCEDGCRLIG